MNHYVIYLKLIKYCKLTLLQFFLKKHYSNSTPLLQHVIDNTELFRVLIYLSSPCKNPCQRVGKKPGSQITRCQMVPHWQWHLDGRLACLRDSWPTALLSIQTAVYLFKSPTTVCMYFGKLLFLGQRFPWHFCICWHQFYTRLPPSSPTVTF